ncbi:MAG: hypothetical protein ACR2HT_03520, partial [Pyrinomonadaceae bacterium]
QLKPESKVNAKTSARLDEGEGEDSEDNDVLIAEKKQTNVEKQVPKAPVNQIKNIVNLFAPVVIKVKRSSDDKNSNDAITRQRIVSNK